MLTSGPRTIYKFCRVVYRVSLFRLYYLPFACCLILLCIFLWPYIPDLFANFLFVMSLFGQLPARNVQFIYTFARVMRKSDETPSINTILAENNMLVRLPHLKYCFDSATTIFLSTPTFHKVGARVSLTLALPLQLICFPPSWIVVDGQLCVSWYVHLRDESKIILVVLEPRFDKPLFNPSCYIYPFTYRGEQLSIDHRNNMHIWDTRMTV